MKIGLQAYVTRSLLLLMLGAGILLALWAVLFSAAITTGFVAPSNAGEVQAREVMGDLRLQGHFSPPPKGLYDYVYFTPGGSVAQSSLSGEALARQLGRYGERDTEYYTATYLTFADGSSCLFSWDYHASFTNPTLQRWFPQVEVLLVVAILISLLVFFLWYVRTLSRQLQGRLAMLDLASAQITAQQLDQPIETRAGIREFDESLQCMDDMRVALRQSLTQQWRAQQQRRQQIAALAHDIKTPLTVIGGNAELLLEEPLPEQQRRMVQSINTAAAHTRQYVEALQQISANTEGEQAPQQVTVQHLLQECSAVLAPLAAAKQVRLVTGMQNPAQQLWGYPVMLMRALENIGQNAIRFAPQGSAVQLQVIQVGDGAAFAVQDEGPGFSASALRHATELFWQQDESRTGTGHYGLGLAVAAEVAHAHGGTVQLQNADGGGARVTLVVGAPGQMPGQQTPAGEPGDPGPTAK